MPPQRHTGTHSPPSVQGDQPARRRDAATASQFDIPALKSSSSWRWSAAQGREAAAWHGRQYGGRRGQRGPQAWCGGHTLLPARGAACSLIRSAARVPNCCFLHAADAACGQEPLSLLGAPANSAAACRAASWHPAPQRGRQHSIGCASTYRRPRRGRTRCPAGLRSRRPVAAPPAPVSAAPAAFRAHCTWR